MGVTQFCGELSLSVVPDVARTLTKYRVCYATYFDTQTLEPSALRVRIASPILNNSRKN